MGSELRVSRELLDEIILDVAPDRASLLMAIVTVEEADMSQKGEIALTEIRRLIEGYLQQPNEGEEE